VSSYYYLMAQLPGILPGTPLAITYDRFVETASRFLSSRDSRILASLSLEPPRDTVSTGSRLLDSWYAKERALRMALEKMRAARMKRDYSVRTDDEEYIGRMPEVQQIARNALAMDNPLEAERYLDSVRLNAVENLRGNHFFDSEAVFAYGLMVLLHERSDRFTVDAGSSSYTAIYHQILENNV